MTIASGSKLGPYEVISAIGAGGMGEVYRAHDPKLDRDVAIKVLPEVFAGDAARMARFQREAKVLASLDHPNIATIHGLEESGGTRALVMQLVEGPTLADRIRQGPIPVDEAVRIARQIADALEYAHERGIIHRDLKPANIKVAADDTVKILDFGLAKALEGDPASIDISTSPTISRMATQQGVLLGTAAYMSPEQTKAKPVDRRADIWAFGCVLYEMLTGKQAFQGDSVTDTLAAVIRAEPDWSQLPAATPMRVRVLLQRCLQKDPKQRLRDIGDARISLDEVLSGAPDVGLPGTPQAPVPKWRRALPWALGLIAVAITGIAVWNLRPTPVATKPVTRFTITLPLGQQLAGLNDPAVALSPDGNQLAYVATTQGSETPQIYLRAMDSSEAKPIPGTEGATAPFFSPDGQWLGFVARGKLNKISLSGGVAQPLADAFFFRGATWGSQGAIVFSTVGPGLQQIPDTGGFPQPLNQLDTMQGDQSWPDFLPRSKAVLYCTEGSATIAVHPIGTGGRRVLIRTGQANPLPRYAPSGHLVYAQSGYLMAVPFDLERLQVKGAAVPVLQGVLQSAGFPGATQYSVSNTGSLVYVPGKLGSILQSRLVWVSRNGAEQPLATPLDQYEYPRISPDGRRIAIGVDSNGGNHISLYDFAREALTRLTFEGPQNSIPVWTPDGKRIAFLSTTEGVGHVSWQLADGSGGLERLTNTGAYGDVPFSWSPDGQTLAFVSLAPAGGIFMLRMSDRRVQQFLQSKALLDAPEFSPDGRWLAYASDESGRREIYVQPYPGPGGKYQISTESGTEPMWNRNGRELFYRNGDKMMAADISTQAGFTAGKPRQLFESRYRMNDVGQADANYDVSSDGQRFLMLKPVEQEQAAPTQINVVLNWTEELKRLVPTGNK